ncbi:MAG TPA: hypothetical protein VEK80_17325 [Kribbellaceae bacterium]|nr:hypothetical protein [Kribbellaceae bacterium]
MSGVEPIGRYAGLTCYTANLTRYLASEPAISGSGAVSRVARSMRLAVRQESSDGRLAFSHHDTPLHLLPDGTALAYAAAPTPRAALTDLSDDLREYGPVLVVANNARLPWSPAYGTGGAAPHWLLILEHHRDRWHVVDEFTGLLPRGEQRPYSGRVTTTMLLEAMQAPPQWTAEQRMRNMMAFGLPVPVPAFAGALWLRRVPGHPVPARLSNGWLTGREQVLLFLSEYVTTHGVRADRHLDDIWAAAGHQAYAYRWRLARVATDDPARAAIQEALTCWVRLPRACWFVVESARRGRPRPASLRTAVEQLCVAELALQRDPTSIGGDGR